MKMNRNTGNAERRKTCSPKTIGGKSRLSKLLSFEKIKPISGSQAEGGTAELQWALFCIPFHNSNK